MNEIIFLKLGGSLITDKQKPYTFDAAMVKQIVGEIQAALTEKPDLQVVIGNGAGSFAHQSAKKYGTKDGFSTNDGKYGACRTHFDAALLNQLLVKECLDAQLAVFSVQPSASILAHNKNAQSIDISILTTLLQKKMIPFIYGDVIIDLDIGATIYSTDTLFTLLAKEMVKQNNQSIRIIHAGRYDGVLDSNKKIIELITPDSFESIKSNLYVTALTDVTGGMIAKVAESLLLAQDEIPSLIVNGSTPGLIKQALLGTTVPGTRIATS